MATYVPHSKPFDVSYKLDEYYKFIYTHTDNRFCLCKNLEGYYLGGIRLDMGMQYRTSMIVSNKYHAAGATNFIPVAETASGKFVSLTDCKDDIFKKFLNHEGIVMNNYEIYRGTSGEWRIRGKLSYNGKYSFPPDFVWDTNILWQDGPIIGTSNGPVFVQWGDPQQPIELVQEYLANSGIVLEEFCGEQILPRIFS